MMISSKEKVNETHEIAIAALATALLFYAVVCSIAAISVTYIALFASVIIASYLWLKNSARFLPHQILRWLFGVWGLIILWQYVSLYFNGSLLTPAPFFRALDYLPIFALAGLPLDRGLKERIAKRAIFVLLSVTAITVILGIIQKLTGITYPMLPQLFVQGRLVGFYGYHIHAGGLFSGLGVLSLCLILFWKTTLKTRMVLIVFLIIFMIGVLFSMSRTYYMSSFILLPIILSRINRRHAVIGLGILLTLLIAAFSFSPTIRERAISITDVKSNPSNVERLYIWKVARDIICDHPITGIGFKHWGDRVSAYTGKYITEWKFSTASFYHAHNVYLNTAAETGLVGLALFLSFWLCLLYFLFTAAGSMPQGSFCQALPLATAYCMMNLLVGGFFEENFGHILNIFLISLLVSLSLLVSVERQNKYQRCG